VLPTRQARRFRVGIRQQGLFTTLYWSAFGYLRPNRFVVLAHDLHTHPSPPVRDDLRFAMWSAQELDAWRRDRTGLAPEFFQDTIEPVRLCAVALDGLEVAGLVWVYLPGWQTRMFRLCAGEAELNAGYVRPEYRGRRIFMDVIAWACSRLAATGFTTAYAAVHSGNGPSLRAFRGAGFRDLTTIRHIFLYRPRVRLPREFRHGGPDMAPTPPTFGAPRPRRGAPQLPAA
jgi:ribosomal protein S18 acetylase RimI-like enzyme